jgi:hypothetical protein
MAEFHPAGRGFVAEEWWSDPPGGADVTRGKVEGIRTSGVRNKSVSHRAEELFGDRLGIVDLTAEHGERE